MTAEVIAIAMMIIMFGGVGGVLYYAFIIIPKKTQEQAAANGEVDAAIMGDVNKAVTTEELLSFKEIKNGMVDMGNHKYRAIVECSSINYHLKTPNEKEVVHVSFKKFLDSLTFPISINIQTRTMDLSKRLNKTKEEVADAKVTFPQLGEYAEQYLYDMQNLPNLIGNNKEKRKYIIIPYDDAATLEGLNDVEKREDAVRNLDLRVSAVRDGLGGIGIKVSRLNTSEIVQLLYNSFNKNGNVDVAEALSKGEFTDVVVRGERGFEELSGDAYVDWVLYDAQTRIMTGAINSKTSDYSIEQYEYIIEQLGLFREDVGAYFKD